MRSPFELAAGGLVWRAGERGGEGPRLVVIHRTKLRDWSLPKGKFEADVDQSIAECALREVREETGCVGRLEGYAGETRYMKRPTAKAEPRPKIVVFFHMVLVEEGNFAANDEVDQLRWVTADEAARLLTHETERRLLAGALRSTPRI